MYSLVWSPKGGSGTTVVACCVALVSARVEPTVIIDLGGDVAPALGASAPSGPGLAEWFGSPRASGASLIELATPVAEGLTVVHPGRLDTRCVGSFGEFDALGALDEVQAERLASACAGTGLPVVIDAGSLLPHETLHQCAGASLMVVRPCYLALRRASRVAHLATGVIMIAEPGRALSAGDVERSLGRPVLAEIPWDPAIARAVDAGLLGNRLPTSLSRTVGRACAVAHAS